MKTQAVVDRYALALSLMRETCATTAQQEEFTKALLMHTDTIESAKQANATVVTQARRIARKDQQDDLDRLLKQNGFLKGEKQRVQVSLVMYLDGDVPDGNGYTVVSKLLQAARGLELGNGTRVEDALYFDWDVTEGNEHSADGANYKFKNKVGRRNFR